MVLVTGPWLAGTTSLIAALRERMPEHTFVEADELGPAHAPAAVVFVVSAIAPLTESDCALVDLAAKYTDLVIGVVSKIDAHRNWRDVLAADRALLAARAPRYQHVPVGRGRGGAGSGRADGSTNWSACSGSGWPTPMCSVETACARGKSGCIP